MHQGNGLLAETGAGEAETGPLAAAWHSNKMLKFLDDSQSL